MEAQPVELDDLQADQEVYSSDGQKIGNVGAVTVDKDTGEPYLEVATSHFQTLHVPKSAIAYAALGQPVRLKVPGKEAKERFRERPNLY